MDVSLPLQVNTVIISVLVGFSLGIVNTLLSVLILPFGRNTVTKGITDVAFSVISAFITYCLFLIFTYGLVRGFVIFFEFLGYLVYRFTFGKLGIKLEKAVNLRIKSVKSKLKEKYLQNKAKKEQQKLKKHLQD